MTAAFIGPLCLAHRVGVRFLMCKIEWSSDIVYDFQTFRRCYLILRGMCGMWGFSGGRNSVPSTYVSFS
jgi:hypothetical protein